ncbi:hypothetical protein HK405_014806 [Cladochytrium tenue]|nr:hypothetical protein HK405_014806 [Cladochytrium tenue]
MRLRWLALDGATGTQLLPPPTSSPVVDAAINAVAAAATPVTNSTADNDDASAIGAKTASKTLPLPVVELLTLTDPSRVAALHARYSAAGAAALRTNSFCAHPRVLRRLLPPPLPPELLETGGGAEEGEKYDGISGVGVHGVERDEYDRLAWRISRAAARLAVSASATAAAAAAAKPPDNDGLASLVLGSIGPTFDVLHTLGRDDGGEKALLLRAELEAGYLAQARGLLAGGASGLLIETARDGAVVAAALDAVDTALGELTEAQRQRRPVVVAVSFSPDDSPDSVPAPTTGASGMRLASGETLFDAARAVYARCRRRSPRAVGGLWRARVAVGVNCGRGVEARQLSSQGSDHDGGGVPAAFGFPAAAVRDLVAAALADRLDAIAAQLSNNDDNAGDDVAKPTIDTGEILLLWCPSAGVPVAYGGAGYVGADAFGAAAARWWTAALAREVDAAAHAAFQQHRQQQQKGSGDSDTGTDLAGTVTVLVGGCCGTSPAHVAAMVGHLQAVAPAAPSAAAGLAGF